MTYTRNAPVTAVLLDIDGTLLDSNDAHAESFRLAFAEDGLSFGFEAIRELIGKGGDKLIPELAGFSAESERGEKISKRKKGIFFDQFFPHLKPFPGAHDLVKQLAKGGRKLSIATSASKDELKQFVARLGIQSYLDSETSSDDADSSKPDPDILQAALKKLKVTANQAVMLGDTPYDVAAARAAGIRVIVFRSGGWDDAKLVGYDEIYDGPEHLYKELGRSCLFATATETDQPIT